MNDKPQRRDAPRFEPPPWEEKQFQELAKQREEKQAEVELDQAVAALSRPKPKGPVESTTDSLPEESAGQATGTEAEKAELDEKVVAAMFSQLKAEEPEKDDALWKIGVAFSGVAAVIGSVLVVWGMAALLQAKDGGAATMIGGATLLVFGGFFVGLGMWMAARSLKQRGVL